MNPPTLPTARLTLRAPRMTDFPVYAAFLASERSKGVGGPLDTKGAWNYFCHDTALWSLVGHGALMMDLAASGETIGSISVNAGPLFPETELGWMVYDGHTGNGYATEAATAVRDWAFSVRGLPTLVSYINQANQPSRRVAERLGAVLDETAPRTSPTYVVYRHRRTA
jgi:RimJ/RimL family protein N-acetyltransferase